MVGTEQLFETALGLSDPWFVRSIRFDVDNKTLTIDVDFKSGSRFALAGENEEHPVHDTQTQRLRHLNFFQHECFLEVRLPRVRLPDGGVRLVKPDWVGHLSGFTLLFEALILSLCREMPFLAVARIVNISWHRVHAICKKYVDDALTQADRSSETRIAVDETSSQKGHDYVTLVANAQKRQVVFVAEGKSSDTIKAYAEDLKMHGGLAENIEEVSIDMSKAFIKGVKENLPNARITFDKFHVVGHASKAVDQTRRVEQKTDPTLKGLRWTILKNPEKLKAEQRSDLEALKTQMVSKRTARAWLYREQLRVILDRKQIHVMRRALQQWCTNVRRSLVEPMKDVAAMILAHLEGIVAWARTRQTNGFLEAINGLFQAAKRRARGYGRFSTMRTVIFLIAGKLDFSRLNPYAYEPT